MPRLIGLLCGQNYPSCNQRSPKSKGVQYIRDVLRIISLRSMLPCAYSLLVFCSGRSVLRGEVASRFLCLESCNLPL
jgi:hypothetical protein